jgi:hypothetical protein
MEPREYLDEQEIEQALARKARSEAHAQAGHVQGQSLRTAFPAAMAVPLASKKAGSERPAIRVLARGRRGLRQAILLGEALGPPRAFDV